MHAAMPVKLLERRLSSPDERPIHTDDRAPPPEEPDLAQGLSTAEAERRLGRCGENTLEEEQRSVVGKLLSYFWGPIPWMIEAAAILSAVVEHWADLGVILTMLLLNAGVGFWQEHKADTAIEKLKQRLALKARVLRDGRWQPLPARLLVPGDVVAVRMGDVIPADLHLAQGRYLSVDESALTGESLPVDKQLGDTAYSGSSAKQGEMTGVVTATGMETFFGHTARLVQKARTRSHFQRAVLRIGNFLIFGTLALVSLIVVVSLFRHDPVLETIRFALILTVAAIPVALPAVLSVTMAIGAEQLARMKAIVSRLVSIEEMAGMDVLCADKTGTLTQNQLTVGRVAAFGDADAQGVLLAAALASHRDEPDAIDAAVLGALAEPRALDGYRIDDFTPFDPVSKRSEVLASGDGEQWYFTKGAPQVVLGLCAADPALSEAVNAHTDDFAAEGFRTLGVARRRDDGPWQFLGLIPLFDPPREDSRETIDRIRAMGVSMCMLTGDHLAIARQIATRLGLGPRIISAEQAFADGRTPSGEEIEGSNSFAQVFPEHKYAIVEALQAEDHIVGMTGDGVNDAPALRKADVGIAVSGATECRPGGGGSGADRAGLVGDLGGSGRGAQDLPAHEQLRRVPHCRNHPRAAVPDPQHPGVRVLPRHGGDGGAAGAAQRRAHHDDRLRQRSGRRRAQTLGHEAHAVGGGAARRSGRARHIPALLARPQLPRPAHPGSPDPDLPQAAGGGPHDPLHHPGRRRLLAAALAELAAVRHCRSDTDRRYPGRRLRLVHLGYRLAAGPDGLGLLAAVLPGQRHRQGGPGQADEPPSASSEPASRSHGIDNAQPLRPVLVTTSARSMAWSTTPASAAPATSARATIPPPRPASPA